MMRYPLLRLLPKQDRRLRSGYPWASWQGIFCDAVHLEMERAMMQNHRPPFPWQFGASLPWMDDD